MKRITLSRINFALCAKKKNYAKINWICETVSEKKTGRFRSRPFSFLF